MPSLSNHQSGRSTKLLLIGDSGTGKTGALTSLVAAGYKIRALDYDNGLDSLKTFIKRECPEKLGNVDYHTLRDNITGMTVDRPLYKGIPDAFTKGLKLLDKWDDGSIPREWDEKTILVLDSLTHFGNAAFAWARAMSPGVKDPRQWYNTAQNGVEAALAMLTADNFRPNVIVSAHINYEQLEEGVMQGFPTSVGKALGPKIPGYFNNFAQVTRKGTGDKVVREIQTAPTTFLVLKNPAPFSMKPALPIKDGLATFFATVRGEK